MKKEKVAMFRPTWAEIDLSAVSHNIKQIKNNIAPATGLLAVVKANAYGHGIVEISQRLVRDGVDFLGVGCVDEGVFLREAGINKPILVFGSAFPEEIPAIVERDLTQTVFTHDTAGALNNCAKAKAKRAPVHVKVDTGMGRLGIWHEEAGDYIREMQKLKNIFIEGVYTHLSSADEKSPAYTKKQLGYFNRLLQWLKRKNIDIPLRHAANSAAVINHPSSHFNLVRPGLAIYGISPTEETDLQLKPVMSFKTKVAYIKRVPKGRHISYSRTHTTKKPAVIATLPVGYGDGYSRLLSNKGEVLIRGRRAPVVGRVCMDHIMVDATGIKDIKIADEAVLFGRQGKDEITVNEIAQLCNTIPYEVTCWLSPRVPRIYI